MRVLRELRPRPAPGAGSRDLWWFDPSVCRGVAWSPDGTMLAAYHRHGNTVTVWDAEGRVLRELQRPGARYGGDSLAFLAQGRQLVTPPADVWAPETALSVFDLGSGELAREVPGPHPGQPSRINKADVFAASPDGALLAVIYGRALVQPVALYSTETWERVAVLEGSASDGTDAARSLAFSADGRLLAVGRQDGRVLVYEVASRRPLRALTAFPEPTYHAVGSVAFSPDGQLLAAGAGSLPAVEQTPDGRTRERPLPDPVRVLRVEDGARVASYDEPGQPVRAMRWSPDGRFLAFLAQGRGLRLWDPLGPGAARRAVPLRAEPTSLAFSPDGARLAACSGKAVVVLDIQTRS